MVAGLAVLALAFWSADFRHGPFFREDGIVEMTAAILFFVALIIGVQRQLYRTLVGFAFCGLALLACLSEISFGARHLGFAMPAMPGGGELDGAQDLVMLAYRALVNADMLLLAAILAIALLTLVVTLAYRSAYAARVIIWLRADHGRLAILTALTVIGIAVVIDIIEVARFAEETLELFGALLMATAALRLQRGKPRRVLSQPSNGLATIAGDE
ncbi:MAG: hypothetical protein ABJP02_15650 [Parasphingorhabdus sp.]|uniref:hypothetical protein n=1 Tax=Parasphingorhabdus sp. TaxID=2709688 RepID=UPI003299623F